MIFFKYISNPFEAVKASFVFFLEEINLKKNLQAYVNNLSATRQNF